MYRTLKLEFKDAIATVTLNRPAARNAMSAELMREMIACAGEIAARAPMSMSPSCKAAACAFPRAPT